MITLDDDPDAPQNLVVPVGLSVAEAMSLDCEFWTPHSGIPWDPGDERARGCRGFGHYLCHECASLSLESEMRQHEHDEDVVPVGWET
jgi:hypothetical protein